MKKKTKIALIELTAVTAAILAGTIIYRETLPDKQTFVATDAEKEKSNSEVIIDINTETEDVPEYKEIIDEETGEFVTAEVQINEPIEQKSATPPEKPKSEESYTNSEKPPAYTKEQTVIEEKPKSNAADNSNQSSAGGKVYVDGFGYVEKAGETKTQTGVSDGDINKMVGSMD